MVILALVFRKVSTPAIVAVEEDEGLRSALERELTDRYSRSYRVISVPSAEEASSQLRALTSAEEEVALILVSHGLVAETEGGLLAEVRGLHPHAQRGLMIGWRGWGDGETGPTILDAMVRRLIDFYVIRPTRTPDELFHQSVSTFLLEWSHARRSSAETVEIISESWTGRAYELREILGRCAIPHSFLLSDSPDGRARVEQCGGADGLPLVIMPDGTVLADPTNLELASAAGATIDPEEGEFDVAIIGAGPAGLSAAVNAASEGLRTLVIDNGGIGGQATSSSLIRNYLGFPRGVSGRRLAESAYEQAWIFGSSFALMQDATGLRRVGDRLHVDLSDGGEVEARTVVLATGASYRRLGVPEIEELQGAGVYYGGAVTEAPAVSDGEAFVVGGANSAGQAALHLSEHARHVTLVVRADSLEASMSQYLIDELERAPNVAVRVRTEVVGGGGDGRLERLVLRCRGDDATETVAADGLFLMIGAVPNTDWLPPELARDEAGFILAGASVEGDASWPLERRPLARETSLPGVFAIGDVRHGSRRRVASAVGEGSVAVSLVHELLASEQARHLDAVD